MADENVKGAVRKKRTLEQLFYFICMQENWKAMSAQSF